MFLFHYRSRQLTPRGIVVWIEEKRESLLDQMAADRLTACCRKLGLNAKMFSNTISKKDLEFRFRLSQLRSNVGVCFTSKYLKHKLLIINLHKKRFGLKSEMHKAHVLSAAGYSFSTQLTCGSFLLVESIAGGNLNTAKRQVLFLAKIMWCFWRLKRTHWSFISLK